MCDKSSYRDAMSRVASAVHVIATQAGGCTASAVTSVTDEPPTMMVCLNRKTHLGETLSNDFLRYPSAAYFSINTLGCCDEDVGKAFAGMTGLKGIDRFQVGDWDMGYSTYSPILRTAVASFRCRVTEIRLISTHYAILGEVVQAVRKEEGDSLVYVDRHFLRAA